MAYKTPQHSAAWALAKAQHWVISRRQLVALGYSAQGITHRIAKGRLRPILRGVYAVDRPVSTHTGWWMAGVLACGDGAVLSHASAAALWAIRPVTGGAIDVSAPRDRRHRGIKTHRRLLTPHDLTRHYAIPVTSVVCTLIDIAPALSRDELEGATSTADKLGLIEPEALRVELEGEHYRHRRGLPKLRQVLDRRTYVMTDTELERRFLPIVRRVGLPLPLTQVYVNGYRVDFYWPDLRLVIETDGLTYHRTPAQQAEDRIRDQVHAAAGLIPLRFTRAQVRYEPGHVEMILRAVASRVLPRGR
jgi:very-short-patch-repair endonuclease